jgi:hypothetical protein
MKRISALLIAALVMFVFTLPFLPAAYAAGSSVEIVRGPSSYEVPAGHNIRLMTAASGSGLNFEWFIRFGGKDYPAFTSQETSGAPVYDCFDSCTETITVEDGAVVSYLELDKVKLSLSGSQVYCIVRGGSGVAVTSRAYVTVRPETEICDPDEFSVKNLVYNQGELCKYAIKRTTYDDSADYHYTWYTTKVCELSTIKASEDTYDSSVFVVDTGDPGTFYITCMVEKTSGGKTNRSYSNLARFVVAETDSDPSYTMGIEVNNAPSKKSYKVGDAINLSGLTLRGMTGQGYFNVSDTNKVEVYPNNIYSTEQKSLTVVYDECAASFPISVSSSAGTKFSIHAVSETDYVTYIPKEPFSLKVAADNANQEVFYSWFISNENGVMMEQVASGDELKFPNGLSVSDVNIMKYYLCMAECDGVQSSILFSVQLRAPDTPEDPTQPPKPTPSPVPTPTPSPTPTGEPKTQAPSTQEPATLEPGTAAPTDDPATQPPEATAETTDQPADNTGSDPAVTQSSGPDAKTAVPENDKSSRKLSNGAIIGIAGGLFGAIIAVGVIVIIAIKRK